MEAAGRQPGSCIDIPVWFPALFPASAVDPVLAAHALHAACAEFSINTAERSIAFLSQIHHESSGLSRLSESFAYTPQRLMAVWPFRFRSLSAAQEYESKGPRAIANYVYSDRMGNGPERSGDGWKYRGQGFLQLTGLANFAEFGEALGLPLVKSPELAQRSTEGARIAARYWSTRGCNELADALNVTAITRAINGGLTGLKDRRATWLLFRSIVGLKELKA